MDRRPKMPRPDILVNTGSPDHWFSENRTDFVAICLSGPLFRRYRRYHMAHPVTVVSRKWFEAVGGLSADAEDFQDILFPMPKIAGDAVIPKALCRAIEMYRANMPYNLDSGDVVRIDEISDERAELKRYVGRYAMVASMLPGPDRATAHRWRVTLMVLDDENDPWSQALVELSLPDVRLTLVDVDWPDENNDDTTSESEAEHDD